MKIEEEYKAKMAREAGWYREAEAEVIAGQAARDYPLTRAEIAAAGEKIVASRRKARWEAGEGI
ncbi:MAG: hypothetical protein U1D67_04275 [Dehalococcoidia bacterium]|nr:hypothetical protein [Dehalococcoidia bacterium]